MTRKRGRRRKKLLDDLKDRRGYSHLKEEALDRTVWRNRLHIQCKKKAVPLQTWSVPEGSRKLRFPDFTTTAQDGGKVVSVKHRPPLTPENVSGTHFC